MPGPSPDPQLSAPFTLDVALPALTLQCGAELARPVAHGWWWGPAEDADAVGAVLPIQPDDPEGALQIVRRSAEALAAIPAPTQAPKVDGWVPTVVCVHALTGDARVGGEGGWWSEVTGPQQPLDPRRVRVICFNNLGSCYGSSGPADEGFPTLANVPRADAEASAEGRKGEFPLPESQLPAPLTTWDQARFLLLALDAMGIERVDLLSGGSVGGMIALAMAALAPERFPRVAAIATLDRATPWIIGWNHVGRQIVADALHHGLPPERALALARQIAHMTYRAGAGLMERHGRRLQEGATWDGRTPYAVQTYLEHQGSKLVARFDARAYVSMLDAMDHHDLGSAPPAPGPHETWSASGPWTGMARIQGRIDAVAIDTDELFFAREIHDLVVRHRMHGHEATWTLLQSPHGHDAFLMSWEPIRAFLRAAVRRIDPERLA